MAKIALSDEDIERNEREKARVRALPVFNDVHGPFASFCTNCGELFDGTHETHYCPTCNDCAGPTFKRRRHEAIRKQGGKIR